MDAPTLQVLTAAPVTINVNEVDYSVKPISVSIIGKWLEKLAAIRVDSLPPMPELMASMKGHNADAVSVAIKTLYVIHQEANAPDLDDLLQWMVSNPLNMFGLIADCVEGEVDRDELFKAVLGELKNKTEFAQRWLAASGLTNSPT